jgi:hypothetical protein
LVRLGLPPLLHTLQPTDFGFLIARLSDGKKHNGVKPAFLPGKAENVIIYPIFQAETKGPTRDSPGRDCFLVFEKPKNTVGENLGQPIRDAIFDFDD